MRIVYEVINRRGKVINQGPTYEHMVKSITAKRERGISTKGMKIVKSVYSEPCPPSPLISREVIIDKLLK
jgi:hypothetical protein